MMSDSRYVFIDDEQVIFNHLKRAYTYYDDEYEAIKRFNQSEGKAIAFEYSSLRESQNSQNSLGRYIKKEGYNMTAFKRGNMVIIVKKG